MSFIVSFTSPYFECLQGVIFTHFITSYWINLLRRREHRFKTLVSKIKVHYRHLVKLLDIYLKSGCSPVSYLHRVEFTDIVLHNFLDLSCFFHKLEKFRDKVRAKTFVGENIGPDVKVLVPDVKVLVPCESTGP